MRTLALAVLALAAPTVAVPDQLRHEVVVQPPNVILMLLDDATVSDIRHMPAVQRLLVDRGTSFVNNYAPFPLCCPARATILTGQYNHNNRVLDNTAPLGGGKVLDDTNTLSTYLDPTHETGYVGKYLNGAKDAAIPPGWNDWRVSTNGTSYNYVRQDQNVNGTEMTLEGYMPTVHGRQARRWFSDLPTDVPFLSWVGWVAPHEGVPKEPYDLSATAYVSPRWRGTYTGPELPDDDSFNEADVSDKPQFVRDLPQLDDAEIREIRQRIRQRRDSLMAVDQQVAKIVAAVRDRGQLGSTYFVFTSDNGQMNGEHKIPRSKGYAYEPSARVPLVIRGPGFPQGLQYTGVTGLQDITPTILDVTDVTAPPTAPAFDGVSLLALVEGTAVTTRAQLIERTETANLTDRQIAQGMEPGPAEARALMTGDPWLWQGIVTSEGWKYVEHVRSGEVELYDLNTDPDETTNLAGRPAHAHTQAVLRARLEVYRDCAGTTCQQ